MTTESTRLLVIRGDDGSYYLISDDTIESARVPAEHRGAVQEALQGDVSGFFDAAPPKDKILLGTVVTVKPEVIAKLGLKPADAGTR